MAKVVNQIIGDDREHHRALERAQRDIEKLRQQNQRLAQQVRTGTQQQRQQTDAFRALGRQALSSLGGMVAGYASVRSVVQQVNDDIREQIELQKRAARGQITAGQSQRQFLANLAGVSAKERKQALAEIARISTATGVTQEKLFVPAGEAVSASGNLKSALDAVRIGAIVNPQDPGGLAAGLLDVAKVTGTTDAQQNIGFVASALQQSRVTTPRAFAQNVVPGAANVAGFGDTDVFSVSLVNALTKRLVDPEGSLSGTAASRFAAVLAKNVPAAATTEERLAAVRADPLLATTVAGGIEQGRTKQALIELFDPDSQVSKDLRDSATALSKITDRSGAGRDFLASLGATDLQRVEGLSRAIEVQAERERLRDPEKGIRGIVSEREIDVIDALRLTPFQQRLLSQRRFLRGMFQDRADIDLGFVRSFAEDIEGREAEFQSQRRRGRGRSRVGRLGFAAGGADIPTEAELEQARLARELLEEFRRTRQAIEQSGRNAAGRGLDQNVRD